MNIKIFMKVSFLYYLRQTVTSLLFVTLFTNSLLNSLLAKTKFVMKTLTVYFLILLFFSATVFGQRPKLTGFNNYTKWIDKYKDNRISAKELLNLDEFVLNDKGTFSFIVSLPYKVFGRKIQTFKIDAIDNDSGMEWQVYESTCDPRKMNLFQLKPISGNITLTCSFSDSEVKHSLDYNYNPQHNEVDQHLNYYLSKEQIQTFSELNEDKINTYKNSKSVSLVIIQNYDRLGNIELPIEKTAKRLLAFTGLDISDAENTSFDLQIIINSNGISHTKNERIKSPSGYKEDVKIYTAVGLHGTIIFKPTNKAYYVNDFNWKKKFDHRELVTKSGRFVQNMAQPYAGYTDMFYNRSFLKVFGEMLINSFELNPVDFYLYASTDENDAISYNAIKLLGELHDARAYESLILIYKKKSIWRQRAAILALGEIQDPRTIDIFIKALGDKDAEIRQNAAYYLFKLNDQRAVEPLILALDDEEYQVVINAARALSKLGDNRAVEPLIRAMDKVNKVKPLIRSFDEDKYVNWRSLRRDRAINVFIGILGNFGDPTAIEHIIPLLEKRRFKKNAQKALMQLTGENIGDKYKDWINWWNEHESEYIHK